MSAQFHYSDHFIRGNSCQIIQAPIRGKAWQWFRNPGWRWPLSRSAPLLQAPTMERMLWDAATVGTTDQSLNYPRVWLWPLALPIYFLLLRVKMSLWQFPTPRPSPLPPPGSTLYFAIPWLRRWAEKACLNGENISAFRLRSGSQSISGYFTAVIHLPPSSQKPAKISKHLVGTEVRQYSNGQAWKSVSGWLSSKCVFKNSACSSFIICQFENQF